MITPMHAFTIRQISGGGFIVQRVEDSGGNIPVIVFAATALDVALEYVRAQVEEDSASLLEMQEPFPVRVRFNDDRTRIGSDGKLRKMPPATDRRYAPSDPDFPPDFPPDNEVPL